MAAINEENDIEEITKKLQDMAEPPSSSRNKLPQLMDLRVRDMAEEMVLKFRRVAEDAYSKYDNIVYDKLLNTSGAPIIIAMKGDQATGRKLVAFYVASILRCPLIKEHDFDNYEEKSEENQAKLWRNICSLALPQLTSGRCVVIDTKLAHQNEFDQLNELSKITKTPLAIFECPMELAESVWENRRLQWYESTSDLIEYIFVKFVEKPTSQYINSMNFNVGEIPIIMVEKEDDKDFSMSACSALMDLRAHIFPTFQSQRSKDCDHKFKLTKIKDEYKIRCCQCRQLVSGSVYRCKGCRIIFHPSCSYFPKSLRLSTYIRTLYLYLRDVVMELDVDASCNCCKQLIRSSSSFRYYSTANGYNLFDLECLFLLPSKLTAKIHEHKLVRSVGNSQSWCTECEAIIEEDTFCYYCLECGIWLDVYCLWLPETVQSSRDRHPLKLSILPRVDSDPYYCHGCENERDTDKWIYCCEDCDFQIHPRCIVKAPCLPRSLSTEISTTKKRSKEKPTDTESHGCSLQELPLCVKSEAEELGLLFKESSKEIKLPIIITMKGHSTERKLVASTLAATFDCLLIEEDSLCKVTNTANEPKLVCYREFSQIALSQLQIGLSVIIDCDLSHESEFFIIRDFAFATKTPLFVVEFKPCDEKKTQDFHRIVPSYYEYDVGNTPKISLDVTLPTLDHIDKLVPRILHSISAYSKELSKEHTQEPEMQSCYRHALSRQKKDDVLEGDICNRCSKKLLNPIIRCKECPLVLHKACTKLPLHIKFYGCPLNLEKYGNDNDKVKCDCCNELVRDYAYITSEANVAVCLDLNCLFTPSEPGVNPHGDPLCLDLTPYVFQCGACGLTSEHKLRYLCLSCPFAVGVKCGWLKETVHFDRHRHPFHLIVSPEHISNQYYCEVCGEERNKNHWVYSCVECDYFIHVRCIGLPETAYCPPYEFLTDESDESEHESDKL